MDHKKRLRFFYKKRLQEKDHSDKNQGITENLSRLNLSRFVKSSESSSHGILAGAYQPLKGEPSCLEFCRKSRSLDFVFPSVLKDQMSFYKPARKNPWKLSSLGFKEPNLKTAEAVSSCDIEIFLVPGLAFDREGRRLGRGLGYYDRFLAKNKALKIGLAWSDQIHEGNLPEKPHDVSMDIIVTEKFILIPDIHKKTLNHSREVHYG